MDNWHVTPRLSLQLGLRYDALPHAWEREQPGRQLQPGRSIYTSQTADVERPTARWIPTGPGFQTVNGSPVLPERHGPCGSRTASRRGLVTNDYNTLQPRVGLL